LIGFVSALCTVGGNGRRAAEAQTVA
jgi:hypothetical protein